jgi:flagellar protein FlgJ
MDVTGMSTYLQTQYANQTKANADATAKSVNGISKDSSKEEITKAVKDFETYMMEQVIKQMKETFVNEDEDEDTTMTQYKDLYLDQAITHIASQLVDQIGGSVTDDFVEQIMRNYGITGTSSQAVENTGLNNEDVSDDIAKANSSTVQSVQS